MIARCQWSAWTTVVALATLSAATIFVLPRTAEAREVTPPAAPVEDMQNANRDADPWRPVPEPATRLLVAPGDSLWSISEKRLQPDASPQRIAREVERTFELNRGRIGDDPDLILPGQELLLPPVEQEPIAAEPAAPEFPGALSATGPEPAVPERAPEPVDVPTALPDLPPAKLVPLVSTSIEPRAEVDAKERRLLGVGVLALTLVVVILMVRGLPMKRPVGGGLAARVPHGRSYYEHYALPAGPGAPEGASGGPPGSHGLVRSAASPGGKPPTSERAPEPAENAGTAEPTETQEEPQNEGGEG